MSDPIVVEVVVQAAPAVVEVTVPAPATIIEVHVPGIQGAAGPSSVSYEHQQAAPALVWTINHNLGFRPATTVYSVGGLEIEALVTHTSTNQTVIAFVVATAGAARFV